MSRWSLLIFRSMVEDSEFKPIPHKSWGRGRGISVIQTFVIPSQQSWRGYSNAAFRGWLGEWVSGFVSRWVPVCVCGSVPLYLVERLQFLPNYFQTSHAHSPWWEEGPYWFWFMGSKVKVNFGTLCIRPCGHDTDYSFCPITFKLHM